MSLHLLFFIILLSVFHALIHSKQIHEYSNSSHTVAAGCIEEERQILLSFKKGVKDPYGKLSSWHGRDCCKWSGVGCSRKNSYITKLDLRGSCDSGYPQDSLKGKLDHWLFELKYLHYLDLSCNNFINSAIPSSIGSMRRLRYLNLSSILFSGIVPPHLGNLSNLLYLDLNNAWDVRGSWVDDLNWLSGLPQLKYLNLGSVNLSVISTGWLQAANRLSSSIEELHFPGCGLHDLPQSPIASNFTSLVILNLYLNDFKGTNFDWLSNITTLTHLDLGKSYWRQSLDNISWKDYLCNLQGLDLSGNDMSGEINGFIDGLSNCSNVSMEELYLRNNKLKGHLPESLGQLKNLRILDLFGNMISGPVAASIGNLSHLTVLSMGFNELNGQFSETNIGKLEGLVSLDIRSNNWVGVISEIHLIHLKNLKRFSLSTKNKSLAFDVSLNWVPSFSLTEIEISTCQMDPGFPLWLKTQTQLTVVILEDLGIRGETPSWFWKRISPQLTYLSLSNNQLSGKLPKVLRLKFDPIYGSTLDLSYNMFKGSPPIVLHVSYLVLRNNSFSGKIPAEFGSQMPGLRELILSQNSLTGNIPTSLGDLKNLFFMSLSSNNLTGKIPQLKGFPSLVRLDLSRNRLVGRIPRSLCWLPRLEELILNNNNLSGNIAALRNCNFLYELRLGVRPPFLRPEIIEI